MLKTNHAFKTKQKQKQKTDQQKQKLTMPSQIETKTQFLIILCASSPLIQGSERQQS